MKKFIVIYPLECADCYSYQFQSIYENMIGQKQFRN